MSDYHEVCKDLVKEIKDMKDSNYITQGQKGRCFYFIICVPINSSSVN